MYEYLEEILSTASTVKTEDGYTFHKHSDGTWTDSTEPGGEDMSFTAQEFINWFKDGQAEIWTVDEVDYFVLDAQKSSKDSPATTDGTEQITPTPDVYTLEYFGFEPKGEWNSEEIERQAELMRQDIKVMCFWARYDFREMNPDGIGYRFPETDHLNSDDCQSPGM